MLTKWSVICRILKIRVSWALEKKRKRKEKRERERERERERRHCVWRRNKRKRRGKAEGRRQNLFEWRKAASVILFVCQKASQV